jgi:hypothetical protein
MMCKYCQENFEHDDQVISLNGMLFHEVECLTNYVIESLADDESLSYLEYLEKRIMEVDHNGRFSSQIPK